MYIDHPLIDASDVAARGAGSGNLVELLQWLRAHGAVHGDRSSASMRVSKRTCNFSEWARVSGIIAHALPLLQRQEI